jgi:Family of unknown function (DUF6498)
LTGEPTTAQGSALERILRVYRTTSDQRSIAALLIANSIPLGGVAFFGWNLATILVIYWLENGIVGFWNVPRMALAGRGAEAATKADPPPSGTAEATASPAGPARPIVGTNGSAAVLIPFFIVH